MVKNIKVMHRGENFSYVTWYTAVENEDIENLTGRLLTLLEASIPEGAQLNALKSLVKQEIRRSTNPGTDVPFANLTTKEYHEVTGEWNERYEGLPDGIVSTI